MPFRKRGGFSRRNLRPVDSSKNSLSLTDSVGATPLFKVLAIAKDSALNANADEVERGCAINAIWISLDFCGLAATGVLQTTNVYLMKNPGANLTGPTPGFVGTSNEKKFVIKEWAQMTMRNQDGNPPYHWEGWIKIPKLYRRMGADDTWQLHYRCSSAAGHISFTCIYKWFK